jgi:hypothetical protein
LPASPPVGRRRSDVGEDAVELGDDLAPVAAAGAVDLEIHHRFPPLGVVAERLDRERTWSVALDADHRVEQAVDDEAARGERVGDRIDQERHVVVDDADPHPAVAEHSAQRFEPDQGEAGRTARGAGGEELGGGEPVLVGEADDLARQGAVDEGMGEGVDDLHVGGWLPRRRCPNSYLAPEGAAAGPPAVRRRPYAPARREGQPSRDQA